METFPSLNLELSVRLRFPHHSSRWRILRRKDARKVSVDVGNRALPSDLIPRCVPLEQIRKAIVGGVWLHGNSYIFTLMSAASPVWSSRFGVQLTSSSLDSGLLPDYYTSATFAFAMKDSLHLRSHSTRPILDKQASPRTKTPQSHIIVNKNKSKREIVIEVCTS